MYVESKFVALENQKESVQNFLEAHLRGSDPYPVDNVYNLYFDTWNLKSAHQAFFSEDSKKKFRLRLYDSTGWYSLQLKIKKDQMTDKIKANMLVPEGVNPFQKNSWESLLDYVPSTIKTKNQLIQEFLMWGDLQPLVSIQYKRYRYRIGDFRITWDTNLRYIASNQFMFAYKKAEPAHGILEIKSAVDGVPSFVKDGLGLKLKKTNISKFKSSLMALKLLHPPFSKLERKNYGFKSIV